VGLKLIHISLWFIVKSTETLVTTGNKTGKEVSVAKTKFMVMCEDENLGLK
jgi:hypothetical protein